MYAHDSLLDCIYSLELLTYCICFVNCVILDGTKAHAIYFAIKLCISNVRLIMVHINVLCQYFLLICIDCKVRCMESVSLHIYFVNSIPLVVV